MGVGWSGCRREVQGSNSAQAAPCRPRLSGAPLGTPPLPGADKASVDEETVEKIIQATEVLRVCACLRGVCVHAQACVPKRACTCVRCLLRGLGAEVT
jgi:hypothetical protein